LSAALNDRRAPIDFLPRFGMVNGPRRSYAGFSPSLPEVRGGYAEYSGFPGCSVRLGNAFHAVAAFGDAGICR
jgi:hypothetical protein